MTLVAETVLNDTNNGYGKYYFTCRALWIHHIDLILLVLTTIECEMNNMAINETPFYSVSRIENGKNVYSEENTNETKYLKFHAHVTHAHPQSAWRIIGAITDKCE